MGLEDPSLSPHSVEELPLGQEDSRQEVEQRSHQCKPSEWRVQEHVQEAWLRASHQDTSDTISGHSSKPLEERNSHLEFVGECMLCDWYQRECGSVWAEQKFFDRLKSLTLAPEQQSSVDSGIRFDQWVLGRSQSQQLFNDLHRQLIYSLNASRQASTILKWQITAKLSPTQPREPSFPSKRGTCTLWVHNPQF